MAKQASDFENARKLIQKANHICVLTGAGISAESGIATFRDSGGLWEHYPIEQVATPEGFQENPERVWHFYNARRKAARTAVPNAAHLALARLEVEKRKSSKHRAPHGNSFTLLTQNIDGLHQQAGSLNVLELHGSVWKVRCTGCNSISSEYPVELPVLPYCHECGEILRPHVVWFGENLDIEVIAKAEAAILVTDLVLVIGTSSMVQPAASYPMFAARRGVPVIEVNMEKTPLTPLAAVSLQGKAGQILPEVIGCSAEDMGATP